MRNNNPWTLSIKETPFKGNIPKVSFDRITPIDDCRVTRNEDIIFDTNRNDELRVLRLVNQEIEKIDMQTKTDCHQYIVYRDGKQFLQTAICDTCDVEPIYGLRFTCVECPDFDLCEECYSQGLHEHKMRCIYPVSAVKASGLTIL